MLVDRVESQGRTVFDCGRDEGRDGCRWAGSGGGQSRIKGTASVKLAVAEWKGTAALVACVVGASGVGERRRAGSDGNQDHRPAPRLHCPAAAMATGATPSPGGGGSAMGAPCEGGGPPNGQDCAVLRGLRRKRVSGSPAAARRILSFFRSRCAGHSQHRGPSVISQTRCWGLFLPISPRRCFRGLSNSST